MFWIILVAAVVVFWIVKGNSYDAAKLRNKVKTWANDEEGYCCECKHCVKDPSRRFSNTKYYCSISNCSDITPETIMNCFEKPIITEKDLAELFALGIWNEQGKSYIRKNILGKKMTFSELDAFLKDLPQKYPNFIDPEYIKRNQ